MRGASTDAGSETELILGGPCGIPLIVNKSFLYINMGVVTLVFSGSVSWPRLCTLTGHHALREGRNRVSTNDCGFTSCSYLSAGCGSAGDRPDPIGAK